MCTPNPRDEHDMSDSDDSLKKQTPHFSNTIYGPTIVVICLSLCEIFVELLRLIYWSL